MIALRLAKLKGRCLFRFPYVFARIRINSGESKEALETNDRAKEIAATFKDAPNCLYLGRVIIFPLHLKSFKLKEYLIFTLKVTQQEMKHSPIALIDEHMPVVVIAPRPL
jgi:glucosamine--fructose-6-phosphate aminotransferase (isomerizing)